MSHALGDPDANPRLFRFLYLNTERVRSLAAMLFGGVPEQLVREAVSGRHSTGSGGVGVPGFASAEAATEVLFSKKEAETLSQHHFLFYATLRRLEQLRRIADFDSQAAGWPEGEFVRLTAPVVVRDYAGVAAAMTGVGRVGMLAAKLKKESLRKEAKAGAQRPQSNELAQIVDLEKVIQRDLPSIREAVEVLFEDVVRLYGSFGAHAFTANLDREFLIERVSVGFGAQMAPGKWTLLTEPEFPVAEYRPDLTGVESSIQDLVDMIGGFAKLSQPDSRLINPLAIYREL